MMQTASCDLLPAQTFLAGVANASPADADYALARAAAGGLVESFADLYERHRQRVYSLCLRMTGDSAEAEDLTQDVFIHLFRTIDSFRGESQFTTWLHRLAVNHVLMHFRRARRKGIKIDRGVEVERLPSREGVRPKVFRAADRIDLEAAIAQLPPGYRAAFVLFDIEGYSHEEIAGMFGYAVGTSKSQLHKARKRLSWLLRTYRLERR